MIPKTILATALALVTVSGVAWADGEGARNLNGAKPGAHGGEGLSTKERVGKKIYFDANLSIGHNQSCAACHGAEVGWTGPNESDNKQGAVYEGSLANRFGNRKPPSSAYATPAPLLAHEAGEFTGGSFWDGRATGEKLGNPAADQAQGPFLNPLEQALPDAACVVYRVCTGSYGDLFTKVWGDAICQIQWPFSGPGGVSLACSHEGGQVDLSDTNRQRVAQAFDAVALSIAAFEDSSEVNAFTSKFDAWLAGKAKLTGSEKKGMQFFQGKGKCAACHVMDGKKPLFTDFTYDNLGLPRNPDLPFYDEPAFNPQGKSWIDQGLGGFLMTRADYATFADKNTGKHKVPTLRNVDKRPNPGFVKAYGHNGYFKSLEEIVHFYNTRDVLPTCSSKMPVDHKHPKCWPAPEVADNVNDTELGDLGLSHSQERSIVAFLRTLSDGWMAGPAD